MVIGLFRGCVCFPAVLFECIDLLLDRILFRIKLFDLGGILVAQLNNLCRLSTHTGGKNHRKNRDYNTLHFILILRGTAVPAL
jgi:hypothetical protein